LSGPCLLCGRGEIHIPAPSSYQQDESQQLSMAPNTVNALNVKMYMFALSSSPVKYALPFPFYRGENQSTE
jgi:hypothetical protein